MQRKLHLLATVVAAAALLTFGCSKDDKTHEARAAQKSPSTTTVQANDPNLAPDFRLRGIDGKEYSLSMFRGRVVILDFWDTWCPPCKAEIPDFVALQEKYGSKGLQIVGIAFARQGLDAVKSFVKQYGINYPILLASVQVVQDYGGIEGIPTTFLIDPKGRIYRKYVGYRPRQVWEQHILELLPQD